MVVVHRVAFVAFDGFNLLDLAGPVEVLHAASLVGGTPPAHPQRARGSDRRRGYATTIATLDGRPVRSASGVSMAADTALADRGPVETLVVVGGLGWPGAAGTRPPATRPSTCCPTASTCTTTTSVCTGALVLGAAGVLQGKTATTHWHAAPQLARYGATSTEQRVVVDGKTARW